MTKFEKQQVMTAARAEFARSPKLQDEFGEPEVYEAFAVAEKSGSIRARRPEENPPPALDPDRQAFFETYNRVIAANPQFRDLWPGGWEQAYEHQIRTRQMRAATEVFGAPVPQPTEPRPPAPPVAARTMPARRRMPH